MKEIFHKTLGLHEMGSISLDLKKGDIVFLRGELGAGKTTLVTQLIRSILGDDSINVTSPTYTYYQQYGSAITHFDLYRVESYEDFVRIGGEELLDSGDIIYLIEWPEKIEGVYTPTYDIFLKYSDDPNTREVTIRQSS